MSPAAKSKARTRSAISRPVWSAGEHSAERSDESENRIEQILLDAGDFQQVLNVRAQRPFDIDECGERVEVGVELGDELVVRHADVNLGPSFRRGEEALQLGEVGQLRAEQFESVIGALEHAVGELEGERSR